MANMDAMLQEMPSTSAMLPPSRMVLLVEDYPTNIMVATMMLEYLGYEVLSATSGAEALRIIESVTHPFMVILMDVNMPEMDGLETTRNIRRLEEKKGFAHTIIGVTAHALAGDRAHCLDAGMNDYMSKPINPNILAQKLAHLVN